MEFLSPYIGEFGRWQLFIYMVCGISSIPGAMQLFVMTFYAPNLDFWCARPDVLIAENVSVETWRNYSSPMEEVGEEVVRSSCEVYDRDYGNVTGADDLVHLTGNRTKQCRSWEYDKGIYRRTMRDEFNLVCSRDVLISTSNAVVMAGFLLSVIINGHLADRFGRRKTILVNNLLLIIVSVAMAFPGTFTVFLILRGFQCFFLTGMSNPGFSLFTETCSEKYRAVLGNLFFWGFAVGIISFSGVAYVLRDWFKIQLAISLPFVLILFLYWFIEESPLWLITQRRYKEAAEVVQRAAKFNKIKAPGVQELENTLLKLYEGEKGEEDVKTYTLLDLLKHRQLRKNTLNMFLCWFVNAFVYYGLSFNTNDLGGDPFINFLISSSVEVPAYIFAAISVRYIGRKYPLTAVMLLGGLACATPVLIPKERTTLLIVFPMIGKFCIASSFVMIYVYTAELLPTVVRNIGIGSCSMVGRFGSIIAPYVKELGIYTHRFVPPLTYGVLAIFSGLLVLLLPETKNKAIPNTIEEVEQIPRSKKKEEEHEMVLREHKNV